MRKIILRPRVDQSDSYMAKLVKYIPAESVAMYEALDGIVPQDKDGYMLVFTWVILTLTPIWVWFATQSVNTPKADKFHVVVSILAFIVWLVVLESVWAIEIFGEIEAWLGSVLLIFATAIIPLVEKIFKRPDTKTPD